jgi:hypothetical protein
LARLERFAKEKCVFVSDEEKGLMTSMPGEHYIPFRSDLSDLTDQVERIRRNESLSDELVSKSTKFCNENLLPQHVICYHAVFIKKWTARWEFQQPVCAMCKGARIQ